MGKMEGKNSVFEWWFTAHFVFGVVYLGMIPILVPTYIISITNSAVDAGVVMAIIGLGALAAPVIGGFADKYFAHRLAQLGGLIALSVGALVFAFAKEDLVFAIAAIFTGLGVATLMMINPSLIVGAGFAQETESAKLTRLNQVAIVGQLVGGLLIAGLTQVGLSFQARFLVVAVVPFIGFFIVFATNKEATERLRQTAAPAQNADSSAKKQTLGTILLTTFGLFLLAMAINGMGQSVLESQYPNYMQRVFNINPALSATALSVTAVVNLLVLGIAGGWMARKGPNPVFMTSLLMRLAAAVILIVLAMLGNVPAILPLAMYVILLVGIAWVDLAGPALASRLSVAGIGATQGLLMGSLALGTFFGALLGGWMAENFGFRILPWLTAIGVGIAIVLGYLAIRKEEPVDTAAIQP
ncbi:MAG: MFS transporter [Anaerolineaceae bacterium]|nr:MAG: MFS transporter [Anaerolineaceae bacterium]